MPLRFTLRAKSPVPLEVEGITPDSLRGKTLAEIEKLEIFQGNIRTPLAEFFAVSGDPAADVHDWEGDLSGVHWMGAKMSSGQLIIHGNIGRHVGSEMTGGEMHVLGDAGDWVGAEMHGGLIHVRGRAGHQVGSAYRGSQRGMTQGTILIGGDAGSEIGSALRSGLIAVGGSAGDIIGMNMLAGTILVFGNSGIRHGAGMKRGTIALLGKDASPLLPSFRKACRCRPAALDLVLRELCRLEFRVPEELFSAYVDLYNGDFLEGGRGEILIRAA